MALLTGQNSVRYSQYTLDQYTGNGSQTTYNLSKIPPSTSSIIVSLDGVKQHVSAYSLTSTGQLILSEAPASGTAIEVVHIASQGVAYVPNDNTVSTTSLIDSAVTSLKIANGNITNQKLDISNLDGSGAMMIPVGTTSQRPSNPQNGMIRKNTTTGYVEYWDPAVSLWVGIGAFQATGGTETSYNSAGYDYKVHTFLASSQLSVTGARTIEYLIVAGGGGGGSLGGGGGAGGVLTGSMTLTSGTYMITVGAGGVGGKPGTAGGNGSNTTAFGLTAIGGGGGGSHTGGTVSVAGTSGGSGGGASDNNNSYSYGSGTAGQGNRGGNGSAVYSNTPRGGGGGGGAGAVGGDVGSGGAGGNGIQSSINGTNYYWGGGGGYGGYSSGARGGNGGLGGGGGGSCAAGASPGGTGGSGGLNPGGNGSAADTVSGGLGGQNTGGGGGGNAWSYDGTGSRSGGSGIVIIRYTI